MQVWSLGWEDPLEKGMAAHSSTLAWKSHGQRTLVGSVRAGSGSWRVRHNWATECSVSTEDKAAFLEEEEEDSIWDINILILLEVAPRVTSTEWGSDHLILLHIIGEWFWGGHWLNQLRSQQLRTVDLGWKGDLRSSGSSMERLWLRELMEWGSEHTARAIVWDGSSWSEKEIRSLQGEEKWSVVLMKCRS